MAAAAILPVVIREESYAFFPAFVDLRVGPRPDERAVGRNGHPLHHGFHLHAVLADDIKVEVVVRAVRFDVTDLGIGKRASGFREPVRDCAHVVR